MAEGSYPGRILRLEADGQRRVLVDGLRSGGDHFTGDIVFGPDGEMYFGVGTLTNSAVVGVDNFIYGWLPEMRQAHDVPARPTVLRGINYLSVDPFTLYEPKPMLRLTGAFEPFGQASQPGEVIPGDLYATGVIYAARPDGSSLRVHADGLRNPYALGFSPEGRFYAIDQGYDGRGSRPVTEAPDPLWEIRPGGWYGWPDFVAGEPITAPKWQIEGHARLDFVMVQHPPLAGQPVLTFAHHSASTKFDFSRNPGFGHTGQMFVAQFGSGAPVTSWHAPEEEKPGFRVVRADLGTGQIKPFLASRNPVYGSTGPQRPVAVKFSPAGDALYVLDFGTMQGNESGPIPYANSGILWRVTRAAQ